MNAKIANGGVFAAMMVVAIHTAGRELQTIPSGSVLWWLVALGHYGACLIAVPYFFVCSGYFLARHFEEDGWYVRECRKRISSLLVPYVFWSLVAAFLPAVVFFLSNLLHGRFEFLPMDCNWSFWKYTLGLSPYRVPNFVPLWYIRTLLAFVIASPLLARAVKKQGGGLLGGLYLAAVVIGTVSIWAESSQAVLFFTKFFRVSSLWYFCLGIHFRANGVSPALRKYALPAFIAGLLIICTTAAMRHVTGFDLLPVTRIAFVPLLLIGFWRILPSRPLPRFLTRSVFAVYVMHALVWRVLAMLLRFPAHSETLSQWVLRWMTGFCAPVAITCLLRKFAPRTAGFIFGGR